MAEYDLIIKALAERYMDQIAAFIRGVEVAVEQIEDKDKEAVAVQRTSDALVKVREDGAERLYSEVKAEDERATLYVALAALSSLRFPKNLILKILEVSKLENIPVFDGIREEWEARGEYLAFAGRKWPG